MWSISSTAVGNSSDYLTIVHSKTVMSKTVGFDTAAFLVIGSRQKQADQHLCKCQSACVNGKETKALIANTVDDIAFNVGAWKLTLQAQRIAIDLYRILGLQLEIL